MKEKEGYRSKDGSYMMYQVWPFMDEGDDIEDADLRYLWVEMFQIDGEWCNPIINFNGGGCHIYPHEVTLFMEAFQKAVSKQDEWVKKYKPTKKMRQSNG